MKKVFVPSFHLYIVVYNTESLLLVTILFLLHYGFNKFYLLREVKLLGLGPLFLTKTCRKIVSDDTPEHFTEKLTW